MTARRVALTGLLLVVLVGAAGAIARGRERDATPADGRTPGARGSAAAISGRPSAPRFEVVIRDAPPTPRVLTDDVDALGRPVTISCSSCHDLRAPAPATRSADDLDEFHQGLTYVHGDLACLACHHPDDYDALRLADGSSLAFADVMTLCSQCHGPRRQSYDRGAHGGMTGHWDLTRGGRVRNTCTDCHDPHAPAFPHMRPTFKPRDRFLSPPSRRTADHE